MIAGEGPAFSAGHDLEEMLDRDLAFYRELFDVCTQMMEIVHEIPQPVIARVHGPAYAAGCQLVAACDLAVAADTATLRHAGREDRALLLDAHGPGQPSGRAQAGDGDAPDRRADLGASPPRSGVSSTGSSRRNALDEAVDELVGQITSFSPHVAGIGKKAFYAQIELDERRAYELAKDVMASNAELDDAQEGIGAFVGKRQPAWSNR